MRTPTDQELCKQCHQIWLEDAGSTEEVLSSLLCSLLGSEISSKDPVEISYDTWDSDDITEVGNTAMFWYE